MMSLDVSIVIVSWNTRALMLDCLAALPAACAPLAWEAIVVDNGSTDDSVAAIRAAFPATRLFVNEHNAGFAAANNQGMRAAGGRYFLLLNSDTLPEPGSIAALARHADEHPRAGLIGPRLLNADGSFQASCWHLPALGDELLNATGLGVRFVRPEYPGFAERECTEPRVVGCITGAAMLARREAVAQAGGMCEDYFMYGEEPDWCWRMARAGWATRHYPGARIVHLGGQSTRQVRAPMLRALYRSKIDILKRFRNPAHANILRSVVTLVWWTKWLLMRPRPAHATIRWNDLSPGTQRK
jgi:N-acetylglucosaminyl-diphospho-decaprenol L-rhamnosyltransferase